MPTKMEKKMTKKSSLQSLMFILLQSEDIDFAKKISSIFEIDD